MTIADALCVTAAALLFDAAIGDPDLLWRRVPHPVAAMGAMVRRLDEALNDPSRSDRWRRAAGIVAVATLVVVAAGAGTLVAALLHPLPGGWLLAGLAGSVLIAQRSLYEHVARVRSALAGTGLGAGREAVAMIVGRDPDSLDESGVSRAAIESCAESLSDGIVAPVFWLALLGLPGLLVYKAVNTADSMIGHRDSRYAAFGWAAARLDDVMNLIPARLSALLVVLAALLVPKASAGAALATAWRDARKHASPNSGWPESAMAGALGVELGGARRYAGEWSDDPRMNAGAAAAMPGHISHALRILVAACVIQASIVGLLALLTGCPPLHW